MINQMFGLLNAPHVHIVINHFPVILVPTGLAIMLFGLYRGSEDLKKAAAWMFVASGGFAAIAFVSGNMAAPGLMALVPGVSVPDMMVHQQAAQFALGGSVLLALICLGGLFVFRGKMLPVRIAVVILLVAVWLSSVMGRTAYLGGKIRHTEIIPAEQQNQSNPSPR
jgi:uncharacterized membrane protein